MGDVYEVLLVAKDHGEVVSLSSTTTALIHIQEGNNHLPVITGQTVGPHLHVIITLNILITPLTT